VGSLILTFIDAARLGTLLHDNLAKDREARLEMFP